MGGNTLHLAAAWVMAQASGAGPPTILVILGLVVSVFWIYCAVKTAMNGRWGLFILGFLCGIAWIVGAFAGPKTSSVGSVGGMSGRQYRKAQRRGATRQPEAIPTRGAGGRCPQCGKRDQYGDRCETCGAYLVG